MCAGGRSIGRLVCLVVIGAVAGLTLSATVANAAAVLPPELVAIEQHTSELKLMSLRFVLRESTVFPAGDHELAALVKLFGGEETTTGEETLAPAASNVSLIWFGQRLTLRTVGGHDYAETPRFGQVDHGRPWVKLGRGGLDELLTIGGRPFPVAQNAKPTSGVPTDAQPPFAALERELSGAREVHAAGEGDVNGQSVTSFAAVLEPSQLEGAGGKPLVSRSLPAPAPPTGTLDVSFAANGLPLSIVIRVQDPQLTDTATLEIPAVDFPLVIQAPPAARTIGIRSFQRFARQSEASKRKRQTKK
jgi:hypothetical protein